MKHMTSFLYSYMYTCKWNFLFSCSEQFEHFLLNQFMGSLTQELDIG